MWGCLVLGVIPALAIESQVVWAGRDLRGDLIPPFSDSVVVGGHQSWGHLRNARKCCSSHVFMCAMCSSPWRGLLLSPAWCWAQQLQWGAPEWESVQLRLPRDLNFCVEF